MIQQQSAYLEHSSTSHEPSTTVIDTGYSAGAASSSLIGNNTTAATSTPENLQRASELTLKREDEDGICEDSEPDAECAGKKRGSHKRKRKTEKQLACLQSELRGSNLLWSRHKIIEISERTGMSET